MALDIFKICDISAVECYHCDTTFTDYHKCNTTILCQEGEVCMKKELISFNDGHHEYELTCQDREVCDGGNDLIIPFGKRHVNARDISIKCCIDDLCNFPKVTKQQHRRQPPPQQQRNPVVQKILSLW
ncbi:hypothetical protein ACF0H5_018321 [Mactra antiquata]